MMLSHAQRVSNFVFLSMHIPYIVIVQFGLLRFLHGYIFCLFHFLGGGEIDGAVEED